MQSPELADDDALAFALSLAQAPLEELLSRACEVRDRHWGRTVTYSPKVFLPLTNLCRNRCDYCSFRQSPGDDGAWTMTPGEVDDWLSRGREQGCAEALFCLGDKPETAFGAYRKTLASFGQSSTVDYLVWGAERALERGLFPHTNAGILTKEDMRRLRPLNVSLGLMLENVSPRLCEPGMPHHRAPDKRPEKRLRMIDEAGELQDPVHDRHPRRHRRDLERARGEPPGDPAHPPAHGHIQEVIVQNFRADPGIADARRARARRREVTHAVALARLLLDHDVGVQAPPNLNPAGAELLLRAGINDFGGISPVTPDYINPRHPWPHLDALGDACARRASPRPAPGHLRRLRRAGRLPRRAAPGADARRAGAARRRDQT